MNTKWYSSEDLTFNVREAANIERPSSRESSGMTAVGNHIV